MNMMKLFLSDGDIGDTDPVDTTNYLLFGNKQYTYNLSGLVLNRTWDTSIFKGATNACEWIVSPDKQLCLIAPGVNGYGVSLYRRRPGNVMELLTQSDSYFGGAFTNIAYGEFSPLGDYLVITPYGNQTANLRNRLFQRNPDNSLTQLTLPDISQLTASNGYKVSKSMFAEDGSLVLTDIGNSSKIHLYKRTGPSTFSAAFFSVNDSNYDTRAVAISPDGQIIARACERSYSSYLEIYTKGTNGLYTFTNRILLSTAYSSNLELVTCMQMVARGGVNYCYLTVSGNSSSTKYKESLKVVNLSSSSTTNLFSYSDITSGGNDHKFAVTKAGTYLFVRMNSVKGLYHLPSSTTKTLLTSFTSDDAGWYVQGQPNFG